MHRFRFQNFELQKQFDKIEKAASQGKLTQLEDRSCLSGDYNMTALIIMLLYVDSMMDMVDDLLPEYRLDFTYPSVKKLPFALSVMTVNKQYSDAENAHLMDVTMAAYLMLLCANEHGTDIVASPQESVAEEATKLASWGGLEITTGLRQKLDLRKHAVGAVNCKEHAVVNIGFADVMEAYFTMTGIHLETMGLEKEFAITFQQEEE